MGEAVPFHPADEEAGRHRARRQRAERSAASGDPTPAARVLPHSIEAEEFLLSCCMLDGADVIARAFAAGVRADGFYEDKHGIIWAVLERLWREQKPMEVSVVCEELLSSKQLDAVGGYAFLTQVSAKIPTTAQASYFIEKVVEQAELRRVIRDASAAVEQCYSYSGGGVGNDPALIRSLDRLQEVRVRSQRDLPAIESDEQLAAAVLPEPAMLIDKVAHVGGVCLFLAPSKASKTFTCMDISVAVASGSPWIGFATCQGAVLHIDFELPKWDLKKRAAKLKELRHIAGPVPVEWWSLRGKSKPIEQLAPLIIGRAPRGKFKLIVLEPAYKILGKRDENDNADVTDFMNWLFAIQEATGSAVLCTHHFAKGDAGKKEAKDRGSGAGAWVRAPDTAIVSTPLEEAQGEDCYRMEFIERSMKRHAPVGVQFEYPVFRVKGGLDLNALREAGRPRESTPADVAKLLGDDQLTHSQWLRVAEKAGMSESTFKRRKAEALEAGAVTQNGPLFFRARTET